MWTYRAPAVVLGCSQRALLDAARQRLGGRAALLQRESGGGAVLAGPWLVSASVVVAPDHAWVRGGIVDSYRCLGQAHVETLNQLGITAHALPPGDVAPANQAAPTVRWACYGSLSPWEVVDARGRKLVGLAQRRRREAVLLVAGTLVGEADWALLCQAIDHADDEPLLRQRTVSCDELTGRPVAAARFAALLAHQLDAALAAQA